MWLIHTESLKLEFVDNPEDREYAILSHTWRSGEVSFQEMANLDIARTKPGFSKIERTCKLAQDRGLSYAWVDTCCIDKTSSAELTEAINSMFRWYKESTVCFVYLSDLPTVSDWLLLDRRMMWENSSPLGEHLPKCRWFTRGWTLQELIASKNVEFYDEGWHIRGNELSMRRQLWLVTGIEEGVLEQQRFDFHCSSGKANVLGCKTTNNSSRGSLLLSLWYLRRSFTFDLRRGYEGFPSAPGSNCTRE